MTTRELDLMVRANRVLSGGAKIREIVLPRTRGGVAVVLVGGRSLVWSGAPEARSAEEGRIPDGPLERLVDFVGEAAR